MKKNDLLNSIKNSIIISCQALPGEPLYVEEKSIMYLMARAAKMAGAKCIRTNSVRDVIAIKKETNLPVIGLIKKYYPGYDSYITPTMVEIEQLIAANTDIIALDCTMRTRGDGSSINDFIQEIKTKYPQTILMADISTFEEGINAWECGVDLISTTMSGYTDYTVKSDKPDSELVKKLASTVSIPVIAEGRIYSPEEAKHMMELGAYAVVVGGAITRPLEIAQRFFKAIENMEDIVV